MFSLFPVVLERLVGLCREKGVSNSSSLLDRVEGPKLLPGYFLKVPLTEMLLPVLLRAEP